jgi:mannose PTS system EIIA component
VVGVLVVSHGRLADALISSVQFLVGKLHRIKGVPVWPEDTGRQVRDRIQQGMAEVDDGDGVLILTDLLGGPPTTLSESFLNDETVEVVTGVNVPMLLTVSSYRKGKPLHEICDLVKKSGRRSIILAKKVLERKGGSHGTDRMSRLRKRDHGFARNGIPSPKNDK